MLSSHPELVLSICAYGDSPRPTKNIDGYAAVGALSSTCITACLLSEFYAWICETDGEAAWRSLGDVAQGTSLDEILYAVLKARPVVMRAEKLEVEEQNKFDAAFLDLDKTEERLATAATDVGDPLVLACGTLAKLATKPKKSSKNCEVVLGADCEWGAKDAVEKVPRSEIKQECLLPTQKTINKGPCGSISGGMFQGTVSRASLARHRQKLKKLEKEIKQQCAVQITYDDFEKDLENFKALCAAAPTDVARLSLVLVKAEALKKLPMELIDSTGGRQSRKGGRLVILLAAIMDAAGPGFVFNDRPVLERADAIIRKAEAELAKQPLDVRRDELVRRRQAANREPEDINKQRTLYQEIKARAAAIDPADYPFTPMDAEARAAACEIERSLWSAPEGRSGRNTVASRRFQLPLCRSFDLGHLADALRDGLSFLIPTSAIEVFPLEHYVQKMEHGAKIHPHLYPLTRE